MKQLLCHCANCGGKIYAIDERAAECESCGTVFSISELNRERLLQNVGKPQNSGERDESGEFKSALDTSEIRELPFAEVYSKAELALAVADWHTADHYSNELIRREPTNPMAYLYRLLSLLHLSGAKALATADPVFEQDKSYKLFIKFADEPLRVEIEGYLEQAKQAAKERAQSRDYINAKIRQEHARTAADYRNLVNIYASLGDYLDSKARGAECLAAERAILKKARIIKILKITVPIAIVLAIILSIVISNSVKAARHDVSKIRVEITNTESIYKSNVSPYVNGCYYIYFDYRITNGTGVEIDYMEVVAHIYDGNKSIGTVTSSFGGYGDNSMCLAAGEEQVHETYLSENQPEKNSFFSALYNATFKNYEIRYEITSVSFSDGEYYFVD